MTTLLLTLASMLAFAANSLLCRAALAEQVIDPALFTGVRLLSGAIMLQVVLQLRRRPPPATRGAAGNWASAAALAAYAAFFSFAYTWLDAGVGTLLLFGAVQVTMIVSGWRGGERFSPRRAFGLALAVVGLGVLVGPSAASWLGGEQSRSGDAVRGYLSMILAGMAWGYYSLRGRGTTDPTAATAGNFSRGAVLGGALVALVALAWPLRATPQGLWLAIASGALTSGLGYVLWYAALKGLAATQAAMVQLTVPVIAAVGGVLLLGETVDARLVLAAACVLGGVAASWK